MKTERDKFLTEQMGECWHDFRVTGQDTDGIGDLLQCKKCHKEDHEDYFKNNNFSTWEGFGKLWEWAQKQEWWDIDFIYSFEVVTPNLKAILAIHVNPDRFADAVYDYLKENQ